MALTYSFRFHKLEISPQELKAIIKGKVRAIWREELTEEMKESIDSVAQLLGRRTNLGNSMSDQRYSEANANFHETGALPNQNISPIEAQAGDPEYRVQVTRAYHDDQRRLYHLLRQNGKLEMEVSCRDDGLLMRDNRQLTCKETCNALDEATKMFFNQPGVGGSITAGMREGRPFFNMYDLCNKVVTKRLAINSLNEDDLLRTYTNDGYKIWRSHVYMIASFAALMVSLNVARISL